MRLTDSSNLNRANKKPSPLPATTTQILDSNLDSADRAESVALDIARSCGFGEITVEHIGLAVHEIMTNAIIHGNHSDIQKKVVLTISRTAPELRIAISDQGDGFDLGRLLDPRSPEALLESSGRGVYLARAFMDEFHVQRSRDKGTTVTMVKRLDQEDHP